MKTFHFAGRCALAISAVALAALSTGCSKPTPVSSGPNSSPQTLAGSVTPMKTVSKLGDLSAFRSIAEDVANLVDKGDLPQAKTRIKDLETQWDASEAGLKPRAAEDWHVLDRSLNSALSALRADSPQPVECKNAAAGLLHAFDALQGKA